MRDVLCGMRWCDGIPAVISLWIATAVSHAHRHACTLCSPFQYLWTTFPLRLLVAYGGFFSSCRTHFLPSVFHTPALFLRDREEGVGLLARKGDGKKKRRMGSRRTALLCVCVLGLHSPDYIPPPFQFLPTRRRQVKKKQLVNCLNSFFCPLQYSWCCNPSGLTRQDEGMWGWLIGRSSCHSRRHLPPHPSLIMLSLLTLAANVQTVTFVSSAAALVC